MEFIGFIIIMLVGAFLLIFITDALQDPAVIQELTNFSPMLGSNAELFTWIATGLLALVIIRIPLKLKLKNLETGVNHMEVIGRGFMFWLEGAIIFLGIISLGYLLSVGWIASNTP